jgi:hypothetical protein
LKCNVCKSTDGVRHFAVHVDGEPLRLQVHLCGEHGDAFLFRVGAVLGDLFREGAGDGSPTGGEP